MRPWGDLPIPFRREKPKLAFANRFSTAIQGGAVFFY
ncbi:hypothetical protein SBV1_3400002 [Verrucomicrobia bacterium]|nr:hypothetical protein SBV1_3400002 [Verrucomicrobiota bacterium]